MMKVRHKQTGQVILVLETSIRFVIGYPEDEPGCAVCKVYWKHDCEEVPPEETWRDVTAECDVIIGQGERDGIKHFGPSNAVCTIYGGYRFRKVPRDTIRIPKLGTLEAITPGWAFIIEKKE